VATTEVELHPGRDTVDVEDVPSAEGEPDVLVKGSPA